MSLEDQLNALSYEIRGAAMDVYNHFGPGLLESIYEKAMIKELQLRDIKVESQVPVKVTYKGFTISDDYRLDLLIEDIMILELKSVAELLPLHYKQSRSYLRLLNKPMGWLINFNEDDFAHGMVKVTNRYYRPD
ncbi:MAG: GxxExxY protein [Bacteroidales bacterium]|nr:GxxExxY protein [Bacteroidales bacterium]